MTVFYRGPCVRITHEVFEVRCPHYRAFAISEMKAIYVTRDLTWLVEPGSAPVRVCSGGLTGAAAVATISGWPIFDSPVMSAVSLAVLAASLVVSLACWRRRVRPNELWAVYRGQLVCLFRTGDRTTFGQVKRALVRVLELIDDTR